jgi:hypothetical protein
MEALIANLKDATGNPETITLWGGEFSIDELKRVADARDTAQAQTPALGDALLKLYNCAITQLDQSATHEGLENCDVLTTARSELERAGYSSEQLKEPKRKATK